VFGPPRPDNRKTFYPSDVNAFGVDANPPITIDGPAGSSLVLEQAADVVLPHPGTPYRWWRTGPNPELTGTDVAAAKRGTLERVDADVDGADALRDVDPTSGTVPALVRGTLHDVDDATPLAIAVNGVIGTTAPAYRDGGVTKFAAMVDPALFRSGTNDVVVYRVDG
jgi:hypothetical protein